MNKRDLLQIQKLFDESFTRSFAQIWDFNLEPNFTRLDVRLEKVESRLFRIESNYVTKDYLDDKIGALRSEINPNLISFDKRTKRLTAVLHDKQILSGTELKEINSI